MKIGLIGINRYAKHLNFACDLHIYAFQEYLRLNGYDATIVDYKPVYYGGFDLQHPAKGAEARYRKAVRRGADENQLARLAETAMEYRSVVTERERRYDKFQAFIDERLRFTEQVYDSDLLETLDPGFDCYICVTDVIWKTLDRHVFDRGFLLGSKAFEGKQKIAYAASRGTSTGYEDVAKKRFLRYLDDFDAVSVREGDFETYIESISDVPVTTVADPVLLHDKEFWSRVTVPPKTEKYLLLYYVMERSTDTIAKAVEYAKLHDLMIVEVSDRAFKFGAITDPDVKHIARYDVGMEEWLGYIQNAECVFTNSFHGCCFSLLFERPFFVGRRNGQKVPNFLRTFGLADRQFAPDVDVRDLSEEIDFAPAREALSRERATSEEFLLSALRAAEDAVANGPAPDLSPFESFRRSLTYSARFHSGEQTDVDIDRRSLPKITEKRVTSGALEYGLPKKRYRNDGTSQLPPNVYTAPGREFAGWTVRVKVDNRWLWLLDDGTFGATGVMEREELERRKTVLEDEARIPHLSVNHISVVVFVARWRTRGGLLSRAWSRRKR